MRYPALLSALAVILLSLVGCDNPFGPDAPIPPNAVAVDPHPAFAGYWAKVEKDAGRTRDFSRVAWYMVPGGEWPGANATTIRGLWRRRTNAIYIADTHWGEQRVVMHEMLHAILGGDGEHKHPLFGTPAYQLAWWE